MERNNKTEKEIRNESLKSIEQAIENNDFSKDELSILKNILKNLDNLS